MCKPAARVQTLTADMGLPKSPLCAICAGDTRSELFVPRPAVVLDVVRLCRAEPGQGCNTGQRKRHEQATAERVPWLLGPKPPRVAAFLKQRQCGTGTAFVAPSWLFQSMKGDL